VTIDKTPYYAEAASRIDPRMLEMLFHSFPEEEPQ
jgi:hypothetical protein